MPQGETRCHHRCSYFDRICCPVDGPGKRASYKIRFFRNTWISFWWLLDDQSLPGSLTSCPFVSVLLLHSLRNGVALSRHSWMQRLALYIGYRPKWFLFSFKHMAIASPRTGEAGGKLLSAVRNRTYYLKHRQRILQAKKDREHTKRAQILSYKKVYYQSHVEKLKAYAVTNSTKIKERKVESLTPPFSYFRLCIMKSTKVNSKTDNSKR